MELIGLSQHWFYFLFFVCIRLSFPPTLSSHFDFYNYAVASTAVPFSTAKTLRFGICIEELRLSVLLYPWKTFVQNRLKGCAISSDKEITAKCFDTTCNVLLSKPNHWLFNYSLALCLCPKEFWSLCVRIQSMSSSVLYRSTTSPTALFILSLKLLTSTYCANKISLFFFQLFFLIPKSPFTVAAHSFVFCLQPPLQETD